MKKKPVEARLPRLNLGALAIATSCMMITSVVGLPAGRGSGEAEG